MKRKSSLAFAGIAAGLSACGGNSPAGKRIGLVVNGSGGPVSGAKVKVASQTVVTTGADGTFSLQGVVTPYDIAVV
jgi:hypothetical protein